MEASRKPNVLIADDSEINRAILKDILRGDFQILEAGDGRRALELLEEQTEEISALLLDMSMPVKSGLDVLAIMNEKGWTEKIAVVVIAADSGSKDIHRAYDLGAMECIARPFDALIIRRRVLNAILLLKNHKNLIDLVQEEIYENEKNGNLLISVLSHIVEFRNGENGLHVMNVNTITELLLKALIRKTDRYHLTQEDITMITMASSMHDIGKIEIDGAILNKPGKLTPEEFEVVKNHSRLGAEMLEQLPFYQDEAIVRYAREICRWHHEKYDGKGYPDGLAGDEIPISAQVVALADIYEALVSERVYKPPFSHQEAMRMILDGECGEFNPILLECLQECMGNIREELQAASIEEYSYKKIKRVTEDMMTHKEKEASQRSIQLMEGERSKYETFANMLQEIQFEYRIEEDLLQISALGIRRLGLPEFITGPLKSRELLKVMDEEDLEQMVSNAKSTQPSYPLVQGEAYLKEKNGKHRYKFIIRVLWSDEDEPKITGIIGLAIDIQEEHKQLKRLELKASLDPLTGLLNHTAAKKKMKERLYYQKESDFAFIIFDLDYFKLANDTYGHKFGDDVLIHIAEKLKNVLRKDDLAVRIGGDEFMVILEYNHEIEHVVDRIFRKISGKYENFPISLSMGISTTRDCEREYDTLFKRADKALYSAKRSGRGRYVFYNDMMEKMFSVLSPIESGERQERN